MTRAEALTKALAAFDQVTADAESANVTKMLAGDLDVAVIDAFVATARESVAESRREYAAFVAELLDAAW